MDTKIETHDLAVITDLKDGSKLRAARRVRISLFGAIFPEDMTREQLWEFVQQIRVIQRRLRMILSDAIRFARRKFGEEAQMEFIANLNLSDDEGEELGYIAQVPSEVRDQVLTDEHYIVIGWATVGGLIKEGEVKSWVIRSVENNLTADELRESIKLGRVIHREDILNNRGATNRTAQVTIQSICTNWHIWKRQLEERGSPIEKLTLSQKRDLFNEIKPIGEVYEQLKAEVEK